MADLQAAQAAQRAFGIRVLFLIVALLLVGKAFHLQVLNKDFRQIADAAGTGKVTVYPSRGLLYDRYGELLVVNNPMYDLQLTYNQFYKHAEEFDTLAFCQLLDIDRDYFEANSRKNWSDRRFSPSKPFVFLSKISAAQFAAFQERLFDFPGFSLQLRNARGYPHTNAAHLLGYISEVSQAEVDSDPEVYAPGDYIGTTGLEHYYEDSLRGVKGIRMIYKDKLGREVGSVKGEGSSQQSVAGTDLRTTIDLELQRYGEELMANKIGSVVAIEPESGEILAMISTPTYNPNELTIDQKRGQTFARLLGDSLKPLHDRSVMGMYPPGSLFKPIVALIALQEGTLQVDRGVSCRGGFFLGAAKTGCHNHPYCRDVSMAIQHSCNAYFVTTFLEAINKGGNAKVGLDRFNRQLAHFGLGRPLGIDFPNEKGGLVPSSEYYDKVYANETSWKAIWIRSLGIGQGEYLMTNLQMANLAAAIANRGYWITPHLVRSFRKPGAPIWSPSRLAKERHDVPIQASHFEPVIEGMSRVVRAGTAAGSKIPNIEMCGKTGTAENPHGDDHSIFFAFAPRENPKIAIAVYVENGTWGSTYGAPIASLMIEKYLNKQIDDRRTWLETRMLQADLINRQP